MAVKYTFGLARVVVHRRSPKLCTHNVDGWFCVMLQGHQPPCSLAEWKDWVVLHPTNDTILAHADSMSEAHRAVGGLNGLILQFPEAPFPMRP